MKRIDLRNQMKKKKLTFIRQDTHKKKRLAKNWRKPRGIDSKLRLQLRGKGKLVKVGYKSPKAVRGLNREGLKEILVCNINDLNLIKEGMVGVIGSTVGARKKIDIIKKATEKKIKLANYTEEFIKKAEEKLKSKKEEQKAKADKKAKKVKAEKEEKKEDEKEKSASEQDTTKTEEEKKKELDKALIKKGAV